MYWQIHCLASFWMLFEVSCQGCEHNAVRLVDGGSAFEGRVELCRNGSWGTVCDDQWDSNDASVVCRQIGFSPEGAESTREAFFGPGTGQILLDNVNCNGRELTLADCSTRGNFNCDHSHDAGVRCQGIFIEVNLTGESSVFVSWQNRPQASQYTLNISRVVNRLGHQIIYSILINLMEGATQFKYDELLLNQSYTICVRGFLVSQEVSACRNIQTLSPTNLPPTTSRNIQTASQNSPTSTPAFNSDGAVSTGILGFMTALLLLLLIIAGIGLAFISHLWSSSLKDRKHLLNIPQNVQTTHRESMQYHQVRQGASSRAGGGDIIVTPTSHKTISDQPCEVKGQESPNRLYEVLEEVTGPSEASAADIEDYKTLEPSLSTPSQNFTLLVPIDSSQQSPQQENDYSHLQRQ